MKQKKVAIYRSSILKYSETFIASQIRAMDSWNACLVGESYDEKGLNLSDIDTKVVGFKGSFLRKIARNISHFFFIRFVALFKIRSVGADIFHIHFGTDAVDVWPLVRHLDMPIVVTLHGYDINIYKEWWKENGVARSRKYYPEELLKIAQDPRVTFLAVSSAIKQRAIEFGIPEGKVIVSHIGIDTSGFAPSPKPVSQRDTVLFVGRLVEKKGCDLLIKAFESIQGDFLQSRLVIIGDGPLKVELEKYAAERGVRVDFMGAQPGSKVAEALGESRVFCLPSIRAENGDAEGFGLVVLEAQASGVPVITSAEGGREEGVVHGVTGYGHREGDVEQIAFYLRKLLEDDVLASNFSISARQFVLEEFDIKSCTLNLERVYDSLCAG